MGALHFSWAKPPTKWGHGWIVTWMVLCCFNCVSVTYIPDLNWSLDNPFSWIDSSQSICVGSILINIQYITHTYFHQTIQRVMDWTSAAVPVNGLTNQAFLNIVLFGKERICTFVLYITAQWCDGGCVCIVTNQDKNIAVIRSQYRGCSCSKEACSLIIDNDRSVGIFQTQQEMVGTSKNILYVNGVGAGDSICFLLLWRKQRDHIKFLSGHVSPKIYVYVGVLRLYRYHWKIGMISKQHHHCLW